MRIIVKEDGERWESLSVEKRKRGGYWYAHVWACIRIEAWNANEHIPTARSPR